MTVKYPSFEEHIDKNMLKVEVNLDDIFGERLDLLWDDC